MGLIAIECPECGKSHLWFTGNHDQRCEFCSKPKPAEPKKALFMTSRKQGAVARQIMQLVAELGLGGVIEVRECPLVAKLEAENARLRAVLERIAKAHPADLLESTPQTIAREALER